MQYFPQLHTTFKLKAVGSLSIPMMLIQTPGSFVWAGSLAARMGWGGWSAWGIYVVSGCLQGTLLMMALSYEMAKRRFGKDGDGEENGRRRNGENGLVQDAQVGYDDDEAGQQQGNGHGERSPLLGTRS